MAVMLHRMHRTFTALAAAAILFGATACSSSTTASAPAASSKPNTAKPSPTHSACSTPPERDVIVRYVVPGLPDSAQVLGNWNYGLCEGTFQSLQNTSPTGAGYCTEAAWASDNPGYNADATPAAPLKKVQVRIGPAC